jgi:hypothetical protein
MEAGKGMDLFVYVQADGRVGEEGELRAGVRATRSKACPRIKDAQDRI